jgi:hypothetical protein
MKAFHLSLFALSMTVVKSLQRRLYCKKFEAKDGLFFI